MVRGCEKRVVRLDTHGSRYFEEVLFVLKDEADSASHRDIVAEAGRIIEENTREREKEGRASLLPYLSFLLGAAVVSAVLLPLLFL